MSKYVRETAAGKSISAYVIFKGSRKVATVQVHFGNGGTCLVNVWQEFEAALRSAYPKASRRPAKGEGQAHYDDDRFSFQEARAGGYGYDKFTAALAGLVIDGHEITDHCSRLGAPKKPPQGLKRWPRDFRAKRGYSLANYQSRFITFGFNPELHEREGFEGNDGYESYYRESGLKYLEAIGYTVIQAI